MLTLIFLIVITDPYRDINYDKINLYEINQEQEIQINTYSIDDERPEEKPAVEYYYPDVKNTYYIFR